LKPPFTTYELSEADVPDKWAVAECSFKMENHIHLQGANILLTKVQCIDAIIRKTYLHLNKINKEDGLVMVTYYSLP